MVSHSNQQREMKEMRGGSPKPNFRVWSGVISLFPSPVRQDGKAIDHRQIFPIPQFSPMSIG